MIIMIKWNFEMIAVLIILGAQGIILKDLLKNLGKLELRGRIETIQTMALLKRAGELGDLLSLGFQCKPSLATGVKI